VQNIKDDRLLAAFGQHLRSLRKKKGLSMKHLADLANLEYSQIARIERGLINTTISTAYSISKALDIDLHKLFQFDVKKSK
jgi:transcriptional regulator with XRE-family HTH domain